MTLSKTSALLSNAESRTGPIIKCNVRFYGCDSGLETWSLNRMMTLSSHIVTQVSVGALFVFLTRIWNRNEIERPPVAESCDWLGNSSLCKCGLVLSSFSRLLLTCSWSRPDPKPLRTKSLFYSSHFPSSTLRRCPGTGRMNKWLSSHGCFRSRAASWVCNSSRSSWLLCFTQNKTRRPWPAQTFVFIHIKRGWCRFLKVLFTQTLPGCTRPPHHIQDAPSSAQRISCIGFPRLTSVMNQASFIFYSWPY